MQVWSSVKDPSNALGISYLWNKVQESVTWEGSHCQAHKQLQDERVGLLTGVEE